LRAAGIRTAGLAADLPAADGGEVHLGHLLSHERAMYQSRHDILVRLVPVTDNWYGPDRPRHGSGVALTRIRSIHVVALASSLCGLMFALTCGGRIAEAALLARLIFLASTHAWPLWDVSCLHVVIRHPLF
jgi:hypothetical protein